MIVMSKCKCRPQAGVEFKSIEKEWYLGQLQYARDLARKDAIKEVITLIQTQQHIWFSQSLTAGSQAFWTNKVQSAQTIIKQLEELIK
jgi:hypothetical protein